MPRLVATTSVNLEGITMDFTIRLLVLTDDLMYGIMKMRGDGHGMPYDARRMVWMTRTD